MRRRARRSSPAAAPVTARPATRTAPAVGSTSRLIERRNVVLPAPLLPRTTTHSPARTTRSSPSRATVPGGNTTESPATSIIGSIRILGGPRGSAGAAAEQVHRRTDGAAVVVFGGREPVDAVETCEQGCPGGAAGQEKGGAEAGQRGRAEPGAGREPPLAARPG